MKHGKKYRQAAGKIVRKQEYSLEDAIAFLKDNSLAKFDESVEAHMKLSINAKKSDESVRATVVLPFGTGRGKKVAVVTSVADKAKEATEAGAVVVGGEEIVASIKDGTLMPGSAFDIMLATPEMMPKLATIAKILGPKGLMPSPKNETVTVKIAEAVEMLSKGKKASFKNDDSGNVHQVIGKLSFPAEELSANFEAFSDAVRKAKPDTLKGKFVLSVTVCSTMGPGVSVKIV
ncbi:MAG: 50S ribosomal protein L1 [Candidatus Moranbacteria bacterium]|nr:50S ribosomal protein L1 [Candidatus Moranbacteria bacterium]